MSQWKQQTQRKQRWAAITCSVIFTFSSALPAALAQSATTHSAWTPHTSSSNSASWTSNAHSHNWQSSTSTFHNPVNLNLSSTSSTISAPRIVNSHPVNILVGGSQLQVTSTTLLTPAERLAVSEVLSHTHQQTITLGSLGNAVGGSFVINSRLSQNLANLVIPQGVTALENAGKTGGLTLTSNFTNDGTLDIYSTNSQVTTATITANSINNDTTGIIATAAPAWATNAVSNLGLQFNSTNNITNAGTIQSNGSIGLTAGGTITNALPSGYTTGSTGVTPTIAAANGINFSAPGGAFNSGSISVYNNVVSLGSGATTGGINVSGNFTNNSTGTILIGNASSATTPNATNGMNVTGTFTNAGTVDLFSTIGYLTTGTLSAGSVANQSSGAIINSVPAGISNYLFDMGLQINSTSNINNAGTIMAPNGISLSAPGGITNSGLVSVNVSTTAFYNGNVTTSGVNIAGDLTNTSTGSIFVSNPNSNSGLVVTGNLSNSGFIDFYATNQPGTSPIVSANTINNSVTGTISSVVPTGATNARPVVNMQLNSVGDINNAGTIQSTGSLGLTAGGAINNASPSGSASATPYMQAISGINLSSGSGTSNSGVISIYNPNSAYDPSLISNGINVTGDITNKAAGQIFIENASGNNSLNVTGTLSNSGVVDIYSAPGYVTNATVTASSINNEWGGIISSVAPSGTANAVANLNMQINTTNDINNAGVIQSGGTLGLTAGSGNFNNSGLLNSANGNINFNAPAAVDISINNMNGTVQAQNGDINIRTANYSGNNNVNISGGNFLSNNFNAYSGQGAINMNVNDISGTMNISAGTAQISSGNLLNIGNINVTGNFEASSPGSLYLRLPNYSTSCFCYDLSGNLVILPGSNITAGEVVLYLGGSFIMTGGSITTPVIGVEAGWAGEYANPNSPGGSIILKGTIITASDYADFSATNPGSGSITIGGVNGLQANVNFTNAAYTWGYSWGLQFGTSYVLFGPNSSVTNTPPPVSAGSPGGTTVPTVGAGNPNTSPSGSNAYNGANYNGTVSSAMNAYNAANYSSANSPSALNSTDPTLSGQMGELASYNSNANGPDLASYNSNANGPDLASYNSNANGPDLASYNSNANGSGLASYNANAIGSGLASYNSNANGAGLGSYSLAANTVSANNAASAMNTANAAASNTIAMNNSDIYGDLVDFASGSSADDDGAPQPHDDGPKGQTLEVQDVPNNDNANNNMANYALTATGGETTEALQPTQPGPLPVDNYPKSTYQSNGDGNVVQVGIGISAGIDNDNTSQSTVISSDAGALGNTPDQTNTVPSSQTPAQDQTDNVFQQLQQQFPNVSIPSPNNNVSNLGAPKQSHIFFKSSAPLHKISQPTNYLLQPTPGVVSVITNVLQKLFPPGVGQNLPALKITFPTNYDNGVGEYKDGEITIQPRSQDPKGFFKFLTVQDLEQNNGLDPNARFSTQTFEGIISHEVTHYVVDKMLGGDNSSKFNAVAKQLGWLPFVNENGDPGYLLEGKNGNYYLPVNTVNGATTWIPVNAKGEPVNSEIPLLTNSDMESLAKTSPHNLILSDPNEELADALTAYIGSAQSRANLLANSPAIYNAVKQIDQTLLNSYGGNNQYIRLPNGSIGVSNIANQKAIQNFEVISISSK